MAVTRDLGPSASQSLTYEAFGNAEDFSKIITNIDPEQTTFLSGFDEADDATDLKFGWMTEGLRPPQVNAHLEKEDYTSGKVGSMEGLENNVQIFVNTGYVSDAQRKTKKIYNEQDELTRQRTKAFGDQARDMEYMLVNNDIRRMGTASVAALSGGIPFFMQVQNIGATLTVATGIISTGATKHGLDTGDFVYFTAATLPTGLSENTIYYVRKDDTNPENDFTIFNTMKDAVENIVAKQVKPTTAGTGLAIVKNNIVDLASTADFTVDDMNNVMQMCYNRGGNPSEAIMSGAKKRRFSQIVAAIGTTQRKSGDKKMDTVVDVFQSDFGTITAKAHRLYPDSRIDFIDKQYWELKWFDRTHEVKGLAKKGNYTEFVIQGALGLQGTQPKASGSLVNIKR